MSRTTDTALDGAYAIAKAHAVVDGAFSEVLMRSWFDAAVDICLNFVGWTVPERQMREAVMIAGDGTIRLAHTPNGPVSFYAGGRLIAQVIANGRILKATQVLCCQCCLTAHYSTGIDPCAFPPSFIQAVARLFTYIAENRGEVQMDDQILSKCGAKTFLAPWTTYVS